LGPGDEPGHAAPEVTSLGRYVVIRRIGAGAMGAVYVAYDPELDRKVALKLLHGESSPKRRRALLMEAQAMAKLTHPNVAAVHDVGEHEQTVYLAMEFVDGVTIGDWLSVEPRRWRVVLEHFLEAGRGLAAAHGRGLVHRDFKPDNVMLDRAGRCVVLDFGLARPAHDATSEDVDPGPVSGALLTEATVGRVAGTPAYMAPEQAMASEVTAAADQFAFCVSLWEALYGERPFVGSTYAEVLASVAEGRVGSASARRVPRWLRRILLRGLRPNAEDRWPSMDALLTALERGRVRWRWQAGAVGLLVAAIPLGVSAAQERRERFEREEQIAACVEAGDAIHRTWNEPARERLRLGMMSTGVSFAEDSVDTLVPWLDAFAEAWRRGRTDVCVHARVEKDWSEDASQRALWCLEDRKLQLEATVRQISEGDKTAARRAVRLASYLDPVDPCLDTTLLDRIPTPPPELQDDVRRVRAQLIESDRLRHRGETEDALEYAAAAREMAEDVAWPPILALARMLEGRCLHELNRRPEAVVVLVDAFFEAQRVGSLEVAFRAARTLMTTKLGLGAYDDALIWSRHADAVARDNVDPGRLDEAEKHYLLSLVHARQGNWQHQLEESQRAFEIRLETLGPRHPITAAAQLQVVDAYLRLSRPEDAFPLAVPAHAAWLDAMGPKHRATIRAAGLCAQAALDQGHPEEALPFIEQNVASLEAMGERATLAQTLDQLGRAYQQVQRLADAFEAMERATALLREHQGPKSRAVAVVLIHGCVVAKQQRRFDVAQAKCEETEVLASVRTSMGRTAEGVALRLEALAWREAATGEGDRGLVGPVAGLGDAQVLAGRSEDARVSYERALEIGADTLDAENRRLVRPLCGLAEVLLDEGEEKRALSLARRANGLAKKHRLRPPLSSRAAFVLARALTADHGLDDESRALAKGAREGYASVDATTKVEVVDAWLAER
jgi:tetratricopeptide (TPR) repeat protein